MAFLLSLILPLMGFAVDEDTARKEQLYMINKNIEEERERQSKIDDFLKVISMIESSGGKNFDHKRMESGIHEGHSAAGRYGLMPNTINEFSRRLEKARPEDQLPQELNTMGPDEKKQFVETNPDVEDKIARAIASHVLERNMGDEEKASYAWNQGHNLTPQRIEDRNYKESDYVKKYNNFKKLQKMFNKD